MNSPTMTIINEFRYALAIVAIALAIGLLLLGSLRSFRNQVKRPVIVCGIFAAVVLGLGAAVFFATPYLARQERIHNEQRHLGTWEVWGMGGPGQCEGCVFREDGFMEYHYPPLPTDHGTVEYYTFPGEYEVVDSDFNTATIHMTSGSLKGVWVMEFRSQDEAVLNRLTSETGASSGVTDSETSHIPTSFGTLRRETRPTSD